MSIEVVVVDDVAAARRMLRTALRFRGRFEVVGEAASGSEAVDLVLRVQPQIVVLDLGLPDLSGEQLVARIREAAPYAKIVVFTGRAVHDRAWFAKRTAGIVSKEHLDELVATLEAISTPPVGVSSSLPLVEEPVSAAIAREYVRRQAARWAVAHLADAAVAIVSELVSNAIEHARCGCDLRLELREGQVLRIEVFDSGRGDPELRQQGIQSERGRGLYVVSALSTSWGVQSIEGDGKVVWAEVSAR